MPGAPEKPVSANFYPAGATKAEVEKWIASLGGAEKASATGFFTTIRRGPDGGFVAVPYSVEYQGELALAAQHLRAAAAATAQPTLKAFLESRAAAFVSNDYYDSDVKWMELDADDRAHHRPVRGLRRRVVQLQGGVRGLHHGEGSGRVRQAAEVCRLAAGD